METKYNDLSLSDKIIKQSSGFLKKVPYFIVNNRWKFIFFYLLLSTMFLIGIPRFTLNQAMDAFFSTDDPSLKQFQWFRYVFGSDEFVMVMYKPKDGDIFSNKSLDELNKLEDKLNTGKDDPNSPLNRITRVRSIISADFLEHKNDTLINRPFIGDHLPKTNEEREALRKLALKHKDYPGLFFSKDSSFGVIMIETDYGARIKKATTIKQNISTDEEDDFDFGEEDGNNKKSTLIRIDDVPELEQVPMDGYTDLVTPLKKVFLETTWNDSNESYFAGLPWLMDFFGEVIMKEMGMISGVSILIIWIVTTFAFRSISALIWPTLTLITGELWILGLIGWTGIEMTFMINIIVFLLLAVSMAISIHILSTYSYNKTNGTSSIDAIGNAYEVCGVPVILAAITTALGLISLYFVPVLAIKNFGVFAAAGVMLTLFSNLLLWPILLSFWAPKIKERKGGKDSLLTKFLNSQQDRIVNNKKLIVIVFIIISIFGFLGIPKVYIDTNFIEMVKDGYGVKESYRFIDKHFGGTATLELLVDTGIQDGVKEPELLKAIDTFTDEVLEKYSDIIVRTRSIVNVTKDSYKNLTDGSEENYKIPDTKEEVSQVLISFESADPATRKMIVDDNWQAARVSMSVISKGSIIYKGIMADIDHIREKHFRSIREKLPKLKISYSGGMMLMVDMINLVSISMIKSFSLSLVVISILIFFLFGSFKFGVLAMIPNIFPIILVMGYAGWMGIPLDSDTLLVLPIAIGIAVDDTIHFLIHYKTELINGMTSSEAIDSSLKKVGQAMVFTTVVLTSGFFVFVFSAYIPLNNFGKLSALAISFALIADLFLLPVLIDIFKPNKKKSFSLGKASGLTALGIFFLLTLSISSFASSDEAIEIAKKMIDRDDGNSIYVRAILISCEFREDNKGKKKCISGKRKKVFESLIKDLDSKGDITKSLILLKEPPSDKGVAFLQEDYKDEKKDSQQWIYMPAIKKLKRIVSADSGPKTGTLFGSEISYEDIEKRHLSDYTYKILDEKNIMGHNTWVMEMLPTAKRRPKTSYSKSINYIDKKSYMVVKSELFDKKERLIKTYLSKKIKKINGIWTAEQQIVVNHKNSRMSMMKQVDIKMNIDFPMELMSTRVLKDSDFRELHLKELRK